VIVSPFTFLGSYFAQIKSPLQYSKFAASTNDSSLKLPGQIIFIVAYFPAFVVSVVFFIFTNFRYKYIDRSSSEYIHFIAPTIMLILHFAKRLFESCCIHICSNKTALSVGCLIAGSYCFAVAVPLYYQLISGDMQNYRDCNVSFKIGCILYVIGQTGNFYHHYLLRRNRLHSKQKYVIPEGGFFHFVWTPHYFFEIMSWIGMAVTSRHLIFYSSIVSMVGYLCGRSQTTKEWYLKKFADKCPDRKAIIPFLL